MNQTKMLGREQKELRGDVNLKVGEVVPRDEKFIDREDDGADSGLDASDCQPESVWLMNLKERGTTIAHDAGHMDQKQIEINEELAVLGRKFFMHNFFCTIVNMLIGLYSILYIPNIARILKITGKSDSTSLSFQRYLRTLTHTVKWFKDDVSLKKSLKQVLGLHRAGSLQGQKAAKDSKDASSGITQFDMVVTQWGFIGPMMVFNYRVPFYNSKEVSEEGFIHTMYLVGKYLGVLDEFNLCQGSLSEVKIRCHQLLTEVIQPRLRERVHLSEQMTFHLFNGINILNPFISQKDFKLFTDKLLLEEEFDTPEPSLTYTLYLFFFQTLLYMPGVSILRTFINNLLFFNIWLADQWSDHIVQAVESSKAKEQSIKDRLMQVFNIPLFTVISVTPILVQKVRNELIMSKRAGVYLGFLLGIFIINNNLFF